MNVITMLKGPDRVRKRPAVIFGADGAQGVLCAVKLLTDIFLTEAALGFCSKITIILHADCSVSIRSADRGFFLDERLVDGEPAWQDIFCRLYPGPREPDEKYFALLGIRHNALYGASGNTACRVASDPCTDLCCVQYASEWMHVEAVRGGVKKSLEFCRGYSVGAIRVEPTNEESGTCIHFRPDPTVFTDIRIPFADMAAYLREAPAAEVCQLHDEETGVWVQFGLYGGPPK